MSFSVALPGRILTVTMNGVDAHVERLVPLRVECFLRPAFDVIVSGVESALGITIPASLNVRFQGSRESVSSSAAWHLQLPDNEWDGLRTAERILIQLAAGADRSAREDAARLHRAVCPVLEKWVDSTFICALELL